MPGETDSVLPHGGRAGMQGKAAVGRPPKHETIAGETDPEPMSELRSEFSDGDSVIHRLDPRGRIVAACLLAVPAALAATPRAAGLALGVGALVALAARLAPFRLLRRLVLVNAFTAFLWLFLPFTVPAAPGQGPLFVVNVPLFGALAASRPGVLLATLLTMKCNAVLLTFTALVATIPVQALGKALSRLGAPDKLCHLLLFTYRYLHVIHGEYQRLRRSMTARGFRPGTNLHTLRTIAWLLGMLLVRSWDRAERVYKAMLCRGFNGRLYTFARFSWRPADTVLVACFSLAAASVAGLDLLPRL